MLLDVNIAVTGILVLGLCKKHTFYSYFSLPFTICRVRAEHCIRPVTESGFCDSCSLVFVPTYIAVVATRLDYLIFCRDGKFIYFISPSPTLTSVEIHVTCHLLQENFPFLQNHMCIFELSLQLPVVAALFINLPYP